MGNSCLKQEENNKMSILTPTEFKSISDEHKKLNRDHVIEKECKKYVTINTNRQDKCALTRGLLQKPKTALHRINRGGNRTG